MVVRTANQGQGPRAANRRIRDDARERLAVMAFSLAVSAGLALLVHFLPTVKDDTAQKVSQDVSQSEVRR